MDKLDFVKSELSSLDAQGLLRTLKNISYPEPSVRRLSVEGKDVINFASNDYLGLAGDKRIRDAIVDYIDKNPAGGTSSRLLGGNSEIHRNLERALAELKRTDASLVFPSGYQTNLSVISSLVNEGDCIITDRLNHASLIDASYLSRAKLLVYPHCDLDGLEKILKRISAGKPSFRRKLIITDALFSMDGDIAPLKDISALAARYGAILYVDEAHSTGIFGRNGGGVAEYLDVEDSVDIKMGTLSKALSSQGGFVCVGENLKNYLVNKSRGFIYTTALAPVCAAAALEAIKIVVSSEGAAKRKSLLEKASLVRSRISEMGFDTLKSVSQIIPVLVGETHKALALSKRLFEKGIYAPAVRYPTVPKNLARLRISLTAAHTDEDMENLLDALKGA